MLPPRTLKLILKCFQLQETEPTLAFLGKEEPSWLGAGTIDGMLEERTGLEKKPGRDSFRQPKNRKPSNYFSGETFWPGCCVTRNRHWYFCIWILSFYSLLSYLRFQFWRGASNCVSLEVVCLPVCCSLGVVGAEGGSASSWGYKMGKVKPSASTTKLTCIYQAI